jgi:hypothetical protein
MPERESPGILMSGSNHTLFPSARKEHRNPCGIFAREWPFTTLSGVESMSNRVPLEGCGRLKKPPWRDFSSRTEGNRPEKPYYRRSRGELTRAASFYLALAQLKVP